MPFKDPEQLKINGKKYYEANRDKIKAKHKEHYETNSDKIRNSRLSKTYGITSEDYERMCIEQNFSCKICKTHITEVSGRYTGKFMVDHCHTTGKVRGLLCHNCNVGLGNFKDNLDYLKAAIAYLEEA